MLKWKENKSPNTEHLEELLYIYNSSKEEFIKTKDIINYINTWSDIIYNMKPAISRLGNFLCKNQSSISEVKQIIRSNFEDENELQNEIYIYFQKYIMTAPIIAESKNKLVFYLETTIGYSISNILRCKRKRKYKPIRQENTSDSIDPALTNVAFYRWFYSSLMENSLYTELWEKIPVSKDTYCKFINKEVKYVTDSSNNEQRRSNG